MLDAKPHQRLRWHYFLLWQMIGFEIWHDTFIAAAAPTAAPRLGTINVRRRKVGST